MLAADVDGDGDQDVLSSSSRDDKIAWYENTDGQGNFGPERVITQRADDTRSIFAGDLDGDGDLDVLATSRGSSPSFTESEVAWYENTDGAGDFRLHVITTQLDRPGTAVADDLDGDGDLDVLVESAVGAWPTSWFENTDGRGGFGPPQLIGENGLLTTADLDGDGDMDVLSSPGGESIDWYENNGEGNFGEPRELIPPIAGLISPVRRVFAADVDGDGDLDLLAALRPFPDNAIAWFENTDGQGTFGTQQIISNDGGDPTAVFAADLDQDGVWM